MQCFVFPISKNAIKKTVSVVVAFKTGEGELHFTLKEQRRW